MSYEIKIITVLNKFNKNDLIKNINFLIENNENIIINIEIKFESIIGKIFIITCSNHDYKEKIKLIIKLYSIIDNFINAFNDIEILNNNYIINPINMKTSICNINLKLLENIIKHKRESDSYVLSNTDYVNFKKIISILNNKEISINSIYLNKRDYRSKYIRPDVIIIININILCLKYKNKIFENSIMLDEIKPILKILAYNGGLNRAILRLQKA